MLAVRDVDVFYGRVRALSHATLGVAPGELVTLVGPNGSGKTTLLRAITGLVAIGGGDITFLGESIAGRAPEDIARLGLAMVPEGRELFGPFTVRENLRLGAYTIRRAAGRAGIAADTDRVLALFPALAPRLDQAVATLSGGEQQMVAIGRALMARPRLLLLDEPSVGLAPLVIRDIFRVLAELKREGLTLLLVEQNARAAFRIADRGYALGAGGIAAAVEEHGPREARTRRAYGLTVIREEMPS
ncbi:MAG: ABC transporter ATP-binding protein [Candidatus Rokubacteria bacterium]|nr:ABC transporter ATP-binding protein [Candidatus Rokubacteria bacterium]